MHVAVTIVGFRNPDDILRCLAALARSTHEDFEIVICENGGADSYKKLTGLLPAALPSGQTVEVILAPRNLGYAGGVNLCLAARPDADAWWILNPDTEPTPAAMSQLVARLEAGDCDAVGSPVHLANGRVQSYGGFWQGWLARAESIGFGRTPETRPDPCEIEKRQNYLNGASLLIGRRFLQTTGPMREDYFLYCEEVEWCLRALSRGMRLGFAPDAIVLHHQGTTMGQFTDLARRARLPIHLSERNKILLTRDCFPAVLPIVCAFSLVLIVYRYGRRAAWRQSLYGLAGWWAGIIGERGAPTWLAS
jgi:N-acetylglucosaminyl-diphospho-decaprenol L-rhamnosyltransferase